MRKTELHLQTHETSKLAKHTKFSTQVTSKSHATQIDSSEINA